MPTVGLKDEEQLWCPDGYSSRITGNGGERILPRTSRVLLAKEGGGLLGRPTL